MARPIIICKECGEEKPHHARGLCRKCYKRQYYEAHREVTRERNRRWRDANPEKRREYGRRWRDANPEKGRERARQWREANPEKKREHRRQWRARKNGATIGPVDRDAIYERDERCIYCGSDKNLTLDHLTPLARGGAHAQDNLAVACRSCNDSKGAKTHREFLANASLNTKP